MDLNDLKKLAGISEFKGYHEYTVNNREIEREQDIKPGTNEWFKLWFSTNGQQLAMPRGFRGRTK
jgi:hypothetical protein